MILSCLARERNSIQVHHLKGMGVYGTVSQLEDPSVPYSCLLCWSTASCRALSNLAVSFLQGSQSYQKHRGTLRVPSPYGDF